MLHGYRSHIGLIALLTLSVSIVGCGSSGPRQTQRMKELGIESVSARELSIQVTAFAVRFAGVVEVAADEIAAHTDDPEILKNAAIWKVYSVPAILLATSEPEPIGAYVGTWAACLLMLEYYESGLGAGAFGDQQAIAIEASRLLVEEIQEIGDGIPRDEDVRRRESESMAAWVKENALRNHLFVARAPSEHLIQLTQGHDTGLTSAAANVQDQLAELTDRISVQTSLLPRQARWQAELAVLEMSDSESIGRVLEATYEGGESIIAAERDTLFSILGAEREALMESVDEQRVATLAWMSGERAAVIAAMREERIATLAQMEEISLRMLDASFERMTVAEADMFASLEDQMERAIDRTFAWVARLLIGTGIAIALALVLGTYVYLTRIRRPAQ